MDTLLNYKVVHNWMLYCENFGCVRIGKTHWAPECLTATNCAEHLAKKFEYYAHERNLKGTEAFKRVYYELDGENQKAVVDWVIENYKGGYQL